MPHGKPNGFTLEADAATKKVTIRIYDLIGYYDTFTAQDLVDALREAGDISEIEVMINSPGGFAFEGITIYNELKGHPANVTVIVQGLAASAASIVAMAGDKIVMNEGSFMMLHQASGFTIGSAADHHEVAEWLDKMDAQLALIYAKRSGKTPEEAKAWMDAETWFTAEEAVSNGLADESGTEDDAGAQIVALAGRMPKFQHAPSEIAALAGLHPPRMEVISRAPRAGVARQPAHVTAADPQDKETNTMEKGKESEAAPEATAATIAELKAAFPKADADFIIAQIEAGATIAQATTAWATELTARLEKSESEKAELEQAATPPPAPPGVEALGSGNTPGAGTEGATDPIEAFNTAVSERITKGQSRQKAVLAVAKTDPDLHKAFLLATNPGATQQRQLTEKFAT